MAFRHRSRLAVLICAGLLLVAGPAWAGGAYPRLQAVFNLPNLTTDPFDFTVTDVQVQILQPDGTTISLPAFFDGGTTWRVRHTPLLIGIYQVMGITLNGQPATFTGLQPGTWTVAGTPTSPGYVQRDPLNPNAFITSNGRRYYPLGQDVAWDTSATTNVAGIIAKLGAAHENWARVWMDHWDNKNLDWPSVGPFGTLSLTVAQKWDAILSAAEQAGVGVQMTLQHHGQYSSTTDPNWPQNPYNTANGGFLANATQFFTNAQAKALTKRKLRYAIARWGYSTSVMGWELFNEVQFTDAAQAGQWTNIAAWHDEMAQFIRSQDSYHHLITTSSQLDQAIWDQCDYYQHHDYPADLISALEQAPGVPNGQPIKPIFGGECGMNNTPYLGYHAPLWSGLMAGQAGASQQWYWDHVDADNAYDLFAAARGFVLLSGLAEQDNLARSSPHVGCPVLGSLSFAPGGGWSTASQYVFTVGDNAPDGIGSLPSYLQGIWHSDMTSNGYTFLVNYSQPGTFAAQVVETSTFGNSIFVMSLDGVVKTNVLFPYTSGGPTNITFTMSVPAGAHSIVLTNAGTDWFNLGNLTLNPYASMLGGYELNNTNFAALWLWHRTNIYYTNATAALTGAVPVSGLAPGAYSATWWDTFAGVPISNFVLNVTGPNPVTVSTPPVLRSVALFAGTPAKAVVMAPTLNQVLATNTPPLILPLVITNSGGLPLAYSLCLTGAVPASYSVSSSSQPGGPVFGWKDISAVGREVSGLFTPLTAKGAKDEGIAGPLNIGFGFPFFSGGQSPDVFTQFYLSPNGYIAFSPFAGDTSTNRPLPSALAPSNCIAFFWDDLDLTAGGNIYCATDSFAGTFTVQFQNVPLKGTGATVTCQLLLKTDGEIVMQYKNMGISNACTAGIQNGARTQGVQLADNQNYLQSGWAVRLTPPAWLALSANAGLVPRTSADTLNVTLNPASLNRGNYAATVLVQTADPSLPLTILPFTASIVLPVDYWRWMHFGTTNNTGAAADSADPDDDGLVNFVEYALGLDPNVPNPNPLSWSVVNGHVTVSYLRPNPPPPDVSYIAEVTGSLASPVWDSGTGYTSQTVTDNGNGTATVSITDLTGIATAPMHFLRVRFSR
ncbi:MAG TPA: hypothetical protein VG167_19775 [Verrucomicrobiae bacterium]|nr:hypothetical protein [Verrucomicrobiae bacterium]